MEMEKPTISIIIPIYKVEKYLRHCLDSITKQSFTDFEVLMIDDGSPDGSGKICEEYQQQDTRFRYFRKPNGGAASARNYALTLARGDYFAFIDSDDFLNKDYLESLYQQFQNTDCDIAICSYYLLNEKGQYFVPMDPSGNDQSFDHLYQPEEWIREFFNRDGMIYTAPWAKLFSRKVFENLYFPTNIKAGDDQFTIWKAYVRANTISFKNNQAYCYIMNSSSLSHADVSAFLNGVLALEEQMATFKAIGLDIDYMIPLYCQRLKNLHDKSIESGNVHEARRAQLKLLKITERVTSNE